MAEQVLQVSWRLVTSRLWVHQKGDYPGGLHQITRALKSRDSSLTAGIEEVGEIQSTRETHGTFVA